MLAVVRQTVLRQTEDDKERRDRELEMEIQTKRCWYGEASRYDYEDENESKKKAARNHFH